MHRETLSLADMIHWDDVIARTTIDLRQLQDTGLHSKKIVYPRSGGLWMRQMSLEFSYQFLTIDRELSLLFFASLENSEKLLYVLEYLNDIGKADDSYWLDNFHMHNTTYNWEELYGKMEKGAVSMTPFAYLDAQTSSTEVKRTEILKPYSDVDLDLLKP